MPDIDNLQISIQTGANNASSAVDKLGNSLKKIRGITAGATSALESVSAKFGKLPANVQKAINANSKAITSIQKLQGVAKSGAGFENLEANIKKFQATLKSTSFTSTQDKVKSMGAAFAELPTNVQKAINANAKLTTSNKKTGDSFKQIKIAAVIQNLKTFVNAARRVADTVSDWITESNAYVENLNLFTVAMGEYAQAAQTYAEKVSEVMGIDPSEWMRNQGIFMTLATGFGVASDKAATMSQQLAQLGYDISSFYNINVEDSMLKLQSGLSGELEPLRRLGWDLSQAKLQAIALSLGIDETVNSMTQAEKASLRYYAIMTQVTTVQGDMARTLNAPANQLRIMRAQLTMATRALGNIFIPMLNKILPYAIAFLRVIRDIASELANIAGFSFPEVDYSSVNMSSIIPEEESTIEDITKDIEPASKAVEKATKNVAKATKSTKDLAKNIKKIKDYTLGIDELNIISDDSSSLDDLNDLIPETSLNDTIDNLDEVTDALKDAGEALGSFDVSVPTYDFLGDAINKQTDKIYQKLSRKIKPIVKWIKDNIGLIKDLAIGVGIAILTWKVASGIMTAFNLISTFLKNLPGKLSTAASGVSNLQRTIGLAFAIVGLTLEFKAFKKIGAGEGNFITVMQAALYSVIGGLGVALTLGLTPAGFVIGAVAAIAIAIAGVTVGQNEKTKQMLSDAFYDGVGTPISEVVSTISVQIDEVTDAYTKINDLGEKYKESASNINSTRDSFTAYSTGLTNAKGVTEEQATIMKDKFDEFKKAVEDDFNISIDIINNAFTKSVQDAAEKLDINIGEMTTGLEEFQAKFSTESSKTADKIQGLLDQASNGKGLSPNQKKELEDSLSYYTDLSDKISTAETLYNQKLGEFTSGKIDLGDEETAKSELATLKQNYLDAIDEMETAFGTSKNAIENLQYDLNVMKDNEKIDEKTYNYFKELFNGVATSIAAGYKTDKAKIDTQMNGVITQINTQIQDLWNEKADTVELNLWDRIKLAAWETSYRLGGVSEDMIQEGSAKKEQEYKNNKIKDFLEPIKTAVDDLKKSMSDSGAEISTNLNQGLVDGANDSKKEAIDAIESAMSEGLGGMKKEADINSPSGVTTGFGVNLMLGLRDGVVNSKGQLFAALSDVLNTALGIITTFSNLARNAFNSMFQDTAKSLTLAKIGANGALSYSPIPSAMPPRMPVVKYASGGYPTTGQLFLAREAGPEMVGTMGGRTTVANNDQIVNGVSQGVYNAVVSAMSRSGNSSGGSEAIYVYLDGKQIAASVEKRQRERGRTIVTGGAF